MLTDAKKIRDREETDSIPLIDDIRFQIHSAALPGMQANNAYYGSTAERKFQLVDQLLLRLGLDA